jgi:O-antigen chain-terminating methyltransferase
MEEIKQRVQERIKKGEYKEEEIREVGTLSLTVPPNVEDLLDEIKSLAASFDALLTPLNALWAPQQALSRPGIKGKIFALIQKLLSPLTKIMFQTQAAFNAQVVQSLNELKVYLARTIDLSTNLAYRHYLNKIKSDIEGIKETHRRLFSINLKVMEQQKNIRKDLRRHREERHPEGLLETPVSHETLLTQKTEEDTPLLDALYLSFEDLHRGNREDIKARQKNYLTFFKESKNVLDIGCGRGEFLEVLKEAGVSAKGVDINPAMITACRAAGLDAEQGDGLQHLTQSPAGHYDGIFCAQVVEHLAWSQILTLLKTAFDKLPGGGKLLMETINPQCLTTFSGLFYLDPTHVNPVHPLTLQFACQAVGFKSAEILYSSEIPDEMKLREVDFFRRVGDISDKFINVLNNNVLQLNELLYAPQDYAVIASKGPNSPA